MFSVSLCGLSKGTLRCYTSICDGIIWYISSICANLLGRLMADFFADRRLVMVGNVSAVVKPANQMIYAAFARIIICSVRQSVDAAREGLQVKMNPKSSNGNVSIAHGPWHKISVRLGNFWHQSKLCNESFKTYGALMPSCNCLPMVPSSEVHSRFGKWIWRQI